MAESDQSEGGKAFRFPLELERVSARGNPPAVWTELARVCARLGRRAEVEATLARLEEMSRNRYVPPSFKAQVHAALGNRARALAELEKAYEDRCEQLVTSDHGWGLRIDSSWQGMESEPRFVALLKKVGLDVWPK